MIASTSNKGLFEKEKNETETRHVAFAINTDGYDNSGLAELIIQNIWPDLYTHESFKIGDVKSKEIENVTFHAMVTYSLKEEIGNNHGDIIKSCLDKIDSKGAPIHVKSIGAGFIGRTKGVDVNDVIYGMEMSKRNIILHTQHSMKNIEDIVRNQAEKRETDTNNYKKM